MNQTLHQAVGIALRSDNIAPLRVWYLPLLAVLALAVVSTLRRWPWPVRLLLHSSWLLCLLVYPVLIHKGD
jgi:hypothetical protein